MTALRPLALLTFVLAFILGGGTTAALAVEAVSVTARPAIDLTSVAERIDGAGESLSFSTAPDAEGIVRRVEVRSQDGAGSGDWVVFALANTSDTQVDRLIVAPHTRLAGSGWWRPDLASRRITGITPSEGFALQREREATADVYTVTLDPGAVVTFAAELAPGQVRVLPELVVWNPDARKDAGTTLGLYHGMVLGVAGLVFLFLLTLTVVRGLALFQAATLFAGTALAFAALEFGFPGRVFTLDAATLAGWQAWAELAIAAAFVVVPFAYLALHRWNRRFLWGFLGWLALLGGAAVLVPFDASLAASVARLSTALAAVVGICFTVWFAIRGFDRAQALLPAWIAAVAWTAGVGALVMDRLDGAIATPALIGGLVLVAALLALTVAQHAFPSAVETRVDDSDRLALALEGAGDAIFDYDVAADRISIGREATAALGLQVGEVDGTLGHFAERLHPQDRDRFQSAVAALVDHGRGRLDLDLRLRADESGNLTLPRHTWFRARMRPLLSREGRTSRCIGTLVDVDAERTSRERLLTDAVHDNLTGLPNRELLIDRLKAALVLAQQEGSGLRPAVFLIDLDRFAQVNEAFGVTTADNVLVSMARRLLHVVKPQDCLARIGANCFALLALSEPDPEGLALLADRLQRAIRLPVAVDGREISVTASLGLVAVGDTGQPDRARAETMIADAEIAITEAKRLGGDRVEPFRPAMRRSLDRDYHLQNDLRHALDRREIEMHYQPIVDLTTERIAGFEALMRWRSPARGVVSPDDFIPLAERNGLIVRLGLFALQAASGEIERFGKAAGEDVFVSVNISSRQLVRQDLIGDVKTVLDGLPGGAGRLKLEFTESMVMDNPEQASIVLGRLRELGAKLALDDFGTGHSSLSRLTRFPFDTVKIDRSLVRSDDEGTRPVVLRALVAMSHDLGMDVIAEGIETQEDAEALRALDCRYGQGFLFGEPMPADAAASALKRQPKAKSAAAQPEPDAELSRPENAMAASGDPSPDGNAAS